MTGGSSAPDRSAGRTAVEDILGGIPVRRPRIVVPPGVYPPAVDSALLCRHTVRELAASRRFRPQTVVELCAGSGIASIYAAIAGADVTAVDDRPEAVAAVAANARANGVAVKPRLADARTWRPHRPAGMVVANPPYVPAPHGPLGEHAWNGGADGREVLDAIVAVADALVAPGGVLLLVQSAVAGVGATVDGLARRDLDPEIVETVRLPFGPVMRSRAEWLTRHGFVASDAAAEDLVVVRAVRAGVA